MQIAEAYRIISQHNRSAWVALATIAAMTGQTPAELAAEVNQLMATDENFRAEPEPMRWRITDDARRYAVKVGDEDRHQISWV